MSSNTPGSRSARLISELRGALPAARVVDDPDVMRTYRRDEAKFTAAGQPAVVVHARTRDDVVAAVRVAGAHGAPVVPRGAGSGLSGGANAIDGCIVLCTASMSRIIEIDPASRLVVVEPGVITADLDRAAAEAGMSYPPDPSSREVSTIGGNLATNAGGLCCVRSGVTRDWTLGLEVVLPNAEVVRTGGRTRKNVAGYDLTSLFVGSEGTLGVITQATMRLRPRPAPAATIVGYFATVPDAGAAIVNILRAITPWTLEIMDRTTIRAVEALRPMDLDQDAAALVLARCALGDEAEMVERCFADAGATYTAATADEHEGELLMAARRHALPALERVGSVMLDDIGVPIEKLPILLTSIEAIAQRRGVRIGTFGHAGDGNMHPTLVYDAGDDDEVVRVGAAFDDVLAVAHELGGTITGEHGVGVLKRAALRTYTDGPTYALQRALKRTIDPAGIMNPGKLIEATA
jgi:glycolate oxidase